MKISLTYMAQLKRLTGKAGEELNLPEGSRFSTLRDALVKRYGDKLVSVLGRWEDMGPAILVFRGQEQIRPQEDPLLKEGDSFTFLAPMAGG